MTSNLKHATSITNKKYLDFSTFRNKTRIYLEGSGSCEWVTEEVPVSEDHATSSRPTMLDCPGEYLHSARSITNWTITPASHWHRHSREEGRRKRNYVQRQAHLSARLLLAGARTWPVKKNKNLPNFGNFQTFFLKSIEMFSSLE